jgi:hypothetical protein
VAFHLPWEKYDTAFMTAATELGYPSVVRIYPCGDIAIFDLANLTICQIKVINQYLQRCLGDRVSIHDYKVRNEVTKDLVMPDYGTF